MKSSLALRTAICLAAASFTRLVAAELIYGIAQVGNSTAIVSFDSSTPGALLSSKFITLPNNETIVAIECARLTVRCMDSAPGAAHLSTFTKLIRSRARSCYKRTLAAPPRMRFLNGFNFGFDWNPTIDRMRIVAETNQNLVASPVTWATQTVATDLFYPVGDSNAGVDPNVVHSAYSNNFAGAATTQLYGIDTRLDILVTQANSAGTLGTVGPLGISDVSAYGGFDISGVTGVAYAALLPANSSQSSLYSINLATGAATSLGVIDGGLIITALTVFAVPEPATASLLLTGLVAAAVVRRRR